MKFLAQKKWTKKNKWNETIKELRMKIKTKFNEVETGKQLIYKYRKQVKDGMLLSARTLILKRLNNKLFRGGKYC